MPEHLSDGEVVNGKKKSEGGFKNGQEDGKWILYYSNGNKKSEATFRNNNYEGHYVSYHENGQKFREGHYAEHQGNSYDGRKESVWYQYDKDGNVDTKVTYEHGRVVERISQPPFD